MKHLKDLSGWEWGSIIKQAKKKWDGEIEGSGMNSKKLIGKNKIIDLLPSQA